MHVYNCTKHETTRFSPYFLLFGREPRLAIDLLLPPSDAEPAKSYSAYMADLRKRMQHAQQVVVDRIQEAGEASKAWYSKKVCGATLHPGDQVLVRQVGFQGKHKIADRWEEDVYVVTTQPNPSIPMFTVRQLEGKGRPRTLHRNMLLPVRSVPSPNSAASPHPSEFQRVTRSQTRKLLAAVANHDNVDRTSESDQCDTASHRPGLHPQFSVLPCRGDSSLDLDEDEVSVLLEESVVLGPCSAASRCSEGGGYEADSSDSDASSASSPQPSFSSSPDSKAQGSTCLDEDRRVGGPLRWCPEDVICCVDLMLCFVPCQCLVSVLIQRDLRNYSWLEFMNTLLESWISLAGFHLLHFDAELLWPVQMHIIVNS